MNRLRHESSLYLRQHADNPIDWWPWGTDAFDAARSLNKPLFLSIGYSSCHWCHVMAHESFENPSIAAVVNELFIPVKVDREERPDVDRLYMDTVVAMTGRGGWPMSVFLDPSGVPIFAGTYFPPQDRYGMPGFVTVLQSVARAFNQTPDKIAQNKARFYQVFGSKQVAVPENEFTSDDLDVVTQQFRQSRMAAYDPRYGGYGDAPKFPPSGSFETLYRLGHNDPQLLASVRHTLRSMCDGGMRDQVRGGFHRYSTDSQWLVPHFEKMLYDQSSFLEALLYESLMPEGLWAVEEANETLAFLMQDMQTRTGFASALDADDPEGEGHFYTFSVDELQALGEINGLYIPEQPNFENRILLTRVNQSDRRQWYLSEGVRRSRERLRNIQTKRTPPAQDAKILVEWNAYLASQCYAWYKRTHNILWLTTAQWIEGCLANACDTRGSQWSVRRGPDLAGDVRFLEDVVAMASCKVAHASSINLEVLEDARGLLHSAIRDFMEGSELYAATADPLLPVRRPAPWHDAPTPAAAVVLVRLCNLLGELLDDQTLQAFARAQVTALVLALRQYPGASAGVLEALREIMHGPDILLVLLPEGKKADTAEAAIRPGVWTFNVSAADRERLEYTRHMPASTELRYLFCSRRVCGLPASQPFGG